MQWWILLVAAVRGAAALCASVSFTEHIIDDDALGGYNLDALDLDGDGDVDALAGSHESDTVAWYENDGAQSFLILVFFTAQSAKAGGAQICALSLTRDRVAQADASSIEALRATPARRIRRRVPGTHRLPLRPRHSPRRRER